MFLSIFSFLLPILPGVGNTRIFVMAFVLHYPKVETTPRDLIAALIARSIWLVLMIISSGFKNQKVQKGGFS
jgi:hypothetical protein